MSRREYECDTCGEPWPTPDGAIDCCADEWGEGD